jgi:hypothetical protein
MEYGVDDDHEHGCPAHEREAFHWAVIDDEQAAHKERGCRQGNQVGAAA